MVVVVSMVIRRCGCDNCNNSASFNIRIGVGKGGRVGGEVVVVEVVEVVNNVGSDFFGNTFRKHFLKTGFLLPGALLTASLLNTSLTLRIQIHRYNASVYIYIEREREKDFCFFLFRPEPARCCKCSGSALKQNILSHSLGLGQPSSGRSRSERAHAM